MALEGHPWRTITDTTEDTSAAHTGPPMDIPAALDHALTLLTSKEDTSRFVGLAILRSILDNQEALRNAHKIITRCWTAVSPRFLDRLLRSDRSQKRDTAEKKSMVELAVAVIHTFALLLSPETIDEERMVGRTEGLLAALTHSTSETTTQILQVLVTFSSGPLGATRLLQAEDLSPLIEITPHMPLALETLKFAFITGGSKVGLEENITEKLNTVIPTLMLGFRGADCSSLMGVLAEIFVRLPPESFPCSTNWFKGLLDLLHNTILTRPSAMSRNAIVQISSTLLRRYQSKFSTMLFRSKPRPDAPLKTTKPFTYIFINLILIDIRSTIPSILEILNSPNYPQTSTRLSASYDLITAFIAFLVQDPETEKDNNASNDLLQAPSLLLKLRKEISETMSLTIELLRDRWDAAISGAANLHPSARVPTAASSLATGTPLSLPWDSANGGVSKDPLTLAAIRTLALWLREDENDSLRSEAGGICDVLLSLFELDGNEVGGFQQPVLMAFEGILSSVAGVEGFLAANGWEILVVELCKILSSGEDSGVGVEIVRVLLVFVESEVSGPSKGEWMELMSFCAELPSGELGDGRVLELRVAVWQLLVELYDKAPGGLRMRFGKEAEKIVAMARRLEGDVEGGDRDVEGLSDGLREVIGGFEGLVGV